MADTSFKSLKTEGQIDGMSCWAACLAWWLKAAADGRPKPTQMQLIAKFNEHCDDTGGFPYDKFLKHVPAVPEYKMSAGLFETSRYRFTNLPVGPGVPVIVIFSYPAIGGTHMNVVFDKSGTKIEAMEPFHPHPGKDGQRTGKYETREASFYLNSAKIGLCWPTVKFT